MITRWFSKLRGEDTEEERQTEDHFAARLWEAWKEAARRAGVKSTKKRGSGPSNLRFCGRFIRLEVELATQPIHGQLGTLLVVRDRGEGSEELTIKPQQQALEPGSRLGRREIEIGDPAFDESFSVMGNPVLAQAGLDVHTRIKLAHLLNGRMPGHPGTPLAIEASFERGVLSLAVTHAPEAAQEELEESLTELLELALGLVHALAMRSDLSSRLASRFEQRSSLAEPVAGVRLASLRMLLREFPHHIATRQALRAARTDPSDEVRLEGAIGDGPRGRGTILASIPNPEISDDCAARAVQALGDGLPFELAVSALRRALTTGRPKLSCAVLLAPSFLRTEALGLMLEALASSEAAVARAAALALGEVGTVAAVPALREVQERDDRELARACRQAIAKIQTRLVGAEQGQISLAGGEGGALSLAETSEAGQLSLVDEGRADRV